MAISKRVRFEVFRRDNHTCRYCGRSAPEVVLTIDHVIPLALGGTDDPSNLVTACRDCNFGKASTAPDGILVSDVTQAQLSISRAMEKVMRERAEVLERRDEYVSEFAVAWIRSTRRGSRMPADWDESISRFYEIGVPLEQLAEFAVIANRKTSGASVWRYFCGCVWTFLRQVQEEAQRQLMEPDPSR